jgi:surfactin family lipopeptide synthetase A
MESTTLLSDAKRKLLEKYARAEVPQTEAVFPRFTPRPVGEHPPLSLVQEQAWRRALLISGAPQAFNESITIHRTGDLDVAALGRSFTEIIRRHEAWRTTFHTMGGKPIQIVHPASSTFTFPLVDLRHLPEAVREAEALRLATEDARKPFDLQRGPLVRAILVRLADQQHRLFMTMHQCVVDGVSVYQVLPSELSALYEAFLAARHSTLPELAIQYADFAYWERKWLQGGALERQLAYWRKQLGGEPAVLQWPGEHARPPVQTFRGAILPFTLARQLTDALKELSQREGVTLFMILLAGFTALLHRYTHQEDIVVGTLSPAGRKQTVVKGLLGYFLNPVALRFTPSGRWTFRELLKQVRKVVSDALSHDDVPFEYVLDEIKFKPDPSRHPLFQVVISLAPPMPELGPGWEQTPMDVESGGAKWDLYLELSDRPNGVIGRAQYNPDLFDAATVQRMARHYQILLEATISDPNKRLCELPP